MFCLVGRLINPFCFVSILHVYLFYDCGVIQKRFFTTSKSGLIFIRQIIKVKKY